MCTGEESVRKRKCILDEFGVNGNGFRRQDESRWCKRETDGLDFFF